MGIERRHRLGVPVGSEGREDGDVLGNHGLDLARVLVVLEGRVGGDQRQLASANGFTKLAIAAAMHEVNVQVALQALEVGWL